MVPAGVSEEPVACSGHLYSPHAAALNAGFRKGDILISFDDRADLQRETDLIAHALFTRRPGERVKVTLLREGKKLNLTLPMQP